ncbi:hypothetical protein BDR05DRAFT_460494 [Suillus weaverae]|nr:hypothetical protein BDR05DRAFT_460494 [Suillus weaverae]
MASTCCSREQSIRRRYNNLQQYIPRYTYTPTKLNVLSPKKSCWKFERMRVCDERGTKRKNNCVNEEMLCGGCMQKYKCHGTCTSAKENFRGMMLLARVLVMILTMKMTLLITLNHSQSLSM